MFRQYFGVQDAFVRWNYDLTPWFPIIENGNESTTGKTNAPTPAQFKMEAWLNIIHGAKGLGYWPAESWGSVPTNILAEMGALLTNTTALKDIILADMTSRTVVSDRTAIGFRVDAMVREDANDVWVFAARLTDIGEEDDPAISTQFTVSGLSNATAQVYGEDRALAVTNGIFSDSFSSHGVHIYQIPKSGGGEDRTPPSVPTAVRVRVQ